MDKGAKQVVVLLAHPDIKSSQANKALMDAIKELEEVAIYNLYEMRSEDAFNVDSWSKIISQASTLVFHHILSFCTGHLFVCHFKIHTRYSRSGGNCNFPFGGNG